MKPFIRIVFENVEKSKEKKIFVSTPNGPPFGKKIKKLKKN